MKYASVFFFISGMACTATSVMSQNISTAEIAEAARSSTVFIDVKFVSPNNEDNICSEGTQGTGFTISKNGHIITAYHILKQPKKCSGYTDRRIRARIGYHQSGEWLPVTLAAAPDEFSDVALLRFPERADVYQPAAVCSDTKPTSGMDLLAVGFPQGTGYSTIDARYSNSSGPNGRWQGPSVFTLGMSGGPIYETQKGSVVAIVQGGLSGTPAVRYMIPITDAANFFQKAGVSLNLCESTEVPPPNDAVSTVGSLINCDRIFDQIKAAEIRQEFSAVVEFGNSYLGSCPAERLIQNMIGVAYFRMSNYILAVDSYKKAIKDVSPDKYCNVEYKNIIYNIIAAYGESGDYFSGISWFDKISECTKQKGVIYNYGVLLRNVGRYQESIAIFKSKQLLEKTLPDLRAISRFQIAISESQNRSAEWESRAVSELVKASCYDDELERLILSFGEYGDIDSIGSLYVNLSKDFETLSKSTSDKFRENLRSAILDRERCVTL